MYIAAHALLYLGTKGLEFLLQCLGCGMKGAKQTEGTTYEGRLLLEVGIAEEFVLHNGLFFYFLLGGKLTNDNLIGDFATGKLQLRFTTILRVCVRGKIEVHPILAFGACSIAD